MSLDPGKWAPQWRETLVLFYAHYSRKSQFLAKVSASKKYKILLFFSISSPSLREPVQRRRKQGSSEHEREPEYGSSNEVLDSQACPWHWEKASTNRQTNKQTNRKEEQEVACGKRKAMAISGLAPMLPEAVEGELAHSEAACMIFGTYFYGRRANCSVNTSDP